MSVDPRRSGVLCSDDPRCYRECRCSRWPDYVNRFGNYVVPHDEEDSWTPALPTTDGGLLPEHWYRSDQGLWQDAGVTPATSDGDVVGRWEDITANNDHVNQANAANKPTLQNGAGDLLNGHPVLRADGTDDYLQGAFTTGGALAQPFTVFVVGQLGAAAVNDNNSRNIIDSDDNVNHMALSQYAVAVPDKWLLYLGIAQPGSVTDANWHIWTGLGNGAGSELWLDGVSDVAGNFGPHNPDGLTVFAKHDGTNPWLGDCVEIIIYDANLSDADKNQIGQYLAARYALSYTDI